jgi:hypothetical protein
MADTIKPTFSKPVSPISKGYQKGFDKAISQDKVKLNEFDLNNQLNEIDSMLDEVEQSLKKKIFSLAKMEALVFSDPKLAAIYEEMSENGEEKYGYHYNETIQNMLFNDYVLNSPTYLQKYKQVVPKEKKRRDKSGINQLKKSGEDMQTRNLEPKPTKPVTEGDEQSTKVLFLVNEKDPGNPDLFAYFPEEAYNDKFKSGYSHVGQHTGVDPRYAKESRPATPEEYADLKSELEGIGYNLDVLNGVEETATTGGAGIGNDTFSGTGQYTAPLGNTTKKVNELEDPEKQPTELDEEDCIISSDGNKYSVSCGGKFLGDFIEWDDAMSKVITWQEANKWYPNIWFISDHGNASIIDKEGNIINETTGSGSSGAYVGPAMWGSGDLMKTKGKAKVKKVPMIKGGTIIQESNYLTESNGFEKFIESLNEEDISYQQKLGRDYQQSHTGSNNGLGVSEVPQAQNRTALKTGIDANTALFIGQDVDKMRDNDVKILHNDMTKNNTMFPHPDNPNLPEDGISGRNKENNAIINDTNAFTSDTVKNWDKQDAGVEMNTIKTGNPDKPNLKAMEESKKINEKAVSKKQQKFMGMVHAVQKGELSSNKVGGNVADAAKSMKPKDAEDFASTKHKGLPEKVKPKKDVNEESQSIISDSPDTMANKPIPIGTQSGNMDMGARSTGGGSMTEAVNLLEEINKELEAFSIHQDKLKKMTEDRKPSALVLKDRLGVDNEKNFKKDLQHSGTKEIIDVEKELQWKDQQTDVDDPYKLGEKLEKGEIKATDAKSGEALKNVGDSANDAGDEIPKRNLSKEEQDEVNLYRLGLGDYVYDNEVGKRFEDRMKADMGDKLYELRQKKLEFRGKAPMYNKDPQPIDQTTADKVQFDKEQTGWNERMGLKEGMITGKFKDYLNKRKIIDFNLNEVWELRTAEPTEFLCELNFDGLGNTYTQKVSVNENVVKAMSGNKFYTNGVEVFVLKAPVQNLSESAEKTAKPVVNEQMKKMKHLVGYNTATFVKQSKIL